MLHHDLIHILCISESKIDTSFPSDQFQIPGYKLYREDRNDAGGGLMIYASDSNPHRLIKEHTGKYEGIEFMTIELNTKSGKWCFLYVYKPPRINDSTFYDFMTNKCEILLSQCKIYLTFGDMNSNILQSNCKLLELCDVFELINLVTEPTCFKETHSLVDVMLTDQPKCLSGVLNYDYGCSDYHNLICVVSKMFAPIIPKRKISHRSIKTFHEDSFVHDFKFSSISYLSALRRY